MKFPSLVVLFFGLMVGSGSLLATEVTRFHVDDKLSQSSLVLDEVGNVVARERLKSFGGIDRSSRENEEWQHSYHGKQRHTSHELVDFGARFYDPEIGRFLSMDPRGFKEASPDSFNRYAFANNNPYRYTDPDGRVVETAWDLANVGIGLASLSNNLSNGNWGAAALDTFGLAVDGAASVVPFLPGGASAAIQARRAADSAASIATRAEAPRNGPAPNGGSAKPHGNDNHDSAINNRVDELHQDPEVSNIRKNQQQVDVDGNKVGTNRPDIQYDKDGCHFCVEFDHVPRNSTRHGERIEQNDPNTIVELNLL